FEYHLLKVQGLPLHSAALYLILCRLNIIETPDGIREGNTQTPSIVFTGGRRYTLPRISVRTPRRRGSMSSHNYIGTQIGEFTVLQAIGHGGMATVYRGSQPLMNREVPLKVISLDDVADKNRDFATRFASEASLIASLEHPHILPVYS